MKIYIVLFFLSSLAVSIDGVPVPCTCAPGPPVCASNFKTYYGVCNMKCAAKNLGYPLFVIYDGKCEDIFHQPQPINGNIPISPGPNHATGFNGK